MSSGCGDVLSLEDLKTAKKNQIFEAEVITGRAGGVAGGASIDFATNANTGQVQKTMPAILRDIGFRPASFDFDTGGTIGENERDLAVLWPAPGGDNDWYYWEGALPKVIPASSTPASTGGVAEGAWRPLGDITLRSDLASGSGATLVGFTGYAGGATFLADYLKEGYIRVSSRAELMAAHDYVKNTLKKRTEIRLSREFQPWTDAQTDIDLSWVTLVGEGDGVRIDATGIPNVAGNYWCRFYDSNASVVGGQPLSQGVRVKGIYVIGPGRNSSVSFRLFHSPEGQLGNFATESISCEEFGFGDTYQQNAYLIDNYSCKITRCGTHVYMPGGFSNYGEGIRYFGGVLGTSAGVAVQNDNPNGAFRLYSTSIDYVGRVAVCNRGSIELYGCHNEFNNTPNPLTGIPYYCGSAGEARIVIHGGEILAANQTLSQSSVFYVGAEAMGVFVRDVKFMALITTTGRIKEGDGVFDLSGFGVIAGGGNTTVSMLKSAAENIFADPSFDRANVVDWYVYQDSAAITSRTDGTNIKLTTSTDMARTGTQSLRAQKIGGTGTLAAFRAAVDADFNTNNAFGMYVKAAAGVTGTMFVSFYYAKLMYINQYGTPVMARAQQIGPTRSVNVASATSDWVLVSQQRSRNRVPAWADCVVVEVTMNSCSAGNYYFDDAEIYQL